MTFRAEVRHVALSIALLIVTSACGGAPNVVAATPSGSATSCAPSRVLLLADLHGGIGQAVRTSHDRGPYEAIVSVGDAVDIDDGPAVDEMARRWQVVESALESLYPRTPRFWVVGNHETGTRLPIDSPARAASLDHLRALDGIARGDPLHFTFSAAGLRWVALDLEATLPVGKSATAAEVAWLDAQLADPTPTVVLSHSPVAGTQGFPPAVPGTMYFANGSTLTMDPAGTKAVFSVANADAVVKTIRAPVALVLSAHLHSYNRWHDPRGIDFVNLGTANTSLPLSANRPGVDNSEFMHAYANPPNAGYAFSSAIAAPMFSVLTVGGTELVVDTYSAQNDPLDHLTVHLPRPIACGRV